MSSIDGCTFAGNIIGSQVALANVTGFGPGCPNIPNCFVEIWRERQVSLTQVLSFKMGWQNFYDSDLNTVALI